MTDPIQRHRITTRDIDLRDYLQIGPDDRGLERVPMFDEWQMATTGISADLEQQRRERTWRDRLPSAADVRQAIVMSVPAVFAIATLTGIAWFINWALTHAVVP